MKMIGMCAVCGVGLQPPGDLEAVHARHHRVEQHDVGQRLRGALQRGLAAGGHQHGVAGLVQRVVQHRQVVGHVVDDQHDVAVARGPAPVAGSSWAPAAWARQPARGSSRRTGTGAPARAWRAANAAHSRLRGLDLVELVQDAAVVAQAAPARAAALQLRAPSGRGQRRRRAAAPARRGCGGARSQCSASCALQPVEQLAVAHRLEDEVLGRGCRRRCPAPCRRHWPRRWRPARRVSARRAQAADASPSRRCRAWPGPSGSRRAAAPRPAGPARRARWPRLRSSKPSGSSSCASSVAVGLLVVDHQHACGARPRSRAAPRRAGAAHGARRACTSGRNSRMRNTEPTPGVLAHRQLAAHQVGQHLGDGQAQARAGRRAGRRCWPRAKGSKTCASSSRAHARAGVLDLECAPSRARAARGSITLPARGELDGVAQQVDQDLAQRASRRRAPPRAACRRRRSGRRRPLAGGLQLEHAGHLAARIGEVHRLDARA